jgi:hypothetical protein
MKYTTYDISVTLKPITIKLEVPNETSCEEMHNIILGEIYRKLDSPIPPVHLDKVCLRIAKE